MDLIKKYLEEENKDTGWKPAQSQRKDKYGNPVKTSNVARSLARQAMQSAVKDLKKGPEAGKRQVEEVEELDELEEPTVQKYITRAKFSTNPKRRAMAQKAQSKLQQKPKQMETEESELDETESKLYDKAFDKYADSFTKKGKTTPEKQAMYKKMAQNAYKMLPGKSARPNLPEEVEELDETPKVDRGLSDDDKVAARTARAKGYTTGRAVDMGNTSGGQFRGSGPSPYKDSKVAQSGDRKGMITKSAIQSTKDRIKSRLNKEEVEELDEAMRHEIAGQVARFIGNKIDPVHGDIMHAHGKEAYRQAAYHIRKTVNDVKDAVSSLHDRLHKQLRTGGLATEAVEDRILDKGHSPERLQKTIDKAREHEKSYFKKRSDSFFKPTDYESRSKEDSRLQRVRKVMSAASAAKQYATGTAPKPFTGKIGRKQ